MATIKSYTDIEQSKKLAEILPLESVDMFYSDIFIDEKHKYNPHHLETYGFKTFEDTKSKESKHLSFIPCWSLAALLRILPNENMLVKTTDGEYYCLAKDVMTKHYDNPVDACYIFTIKLHELNLL